jgi:hypothetical protein
MQIKKSAAIDLWHTATRLAKALDIHASTVNGWPEDLNARQSASVIGASIMYKGLAKTEAYLGRLPR